LICYGSSAIDVGLAGIKQGGHSDRRADMCILFKSGTKQAKDQDAL
jgi:hypothetical protein